MYVRILITFFILLLFLTKDYTQTTDTTSLFQFQERHEKGIIVGFHQFRNTFIELGVTKSKSKYGCFWGSYFKGNSISTEYNPFQQIIGVTYNRWSSIFGLFVIGANANVYSNFSTINLGVKPYFGLGSGAISISYGYNFQFLKQKIQDINTNCLSIRYVISF